MDIKAYREHVKALAAQRTGEAVYNGSAEHAAVIVEQMFCSATSRVRILTGDLNARVYGTQRVVQRAKEFLGHSDHRLEILLEHRTFSPSHPLIEEISAEANVTFHHIPADLSDRVNYHLMTADDDCFRFEAEKNSHAAVAAFGDPETARNLNSIFKIIQDASTPIDMEHVAG